MTIRETIRPTLPSIPGPTPFLEQGDHLSREEFEDRYSVMPDIKKAELIDGVVFMASAVRLEYHAAPHALLTTWLGLYFAATPGIHIGDNGTVRLDPANEPQPDLMLLIDEKHGGHARIGPDGYVEGGPELVAEISGSSASIDLNTKLHVYRRNGVREYIVWRVFDQQIDWFILRNGEYQNLTPTDGIHRSETFPGLWLDAAAMTRGDLAGALKVLQSGIALPEHETFAAQFR